MPGVSTVPFEAHPFTIASIDTTRDETPSDIIPKAGQEAPDETDPFWKELVFFVNIQGGFTKRLREAARKGGKLKVFVDGPYGNPPNLSDYDTSVLVAGGSGVSFALPLLLEGIRNVAAGKSNTKRITFIWSVRDPNHVLRISSALETATKLAPRGLTISIRIYVTRATTLQLWDNVSVDSVKKGCELQVEKCTPSLLEDPAAQTIRGSRPNLKHILQTEADLTDGRMGVTVCGSQSVAAAVKNALGFSIAGPSSIMKGGPSITLNTETFGYA